MDSFYEQPRPAPVPTSTAKIPVVPVVPEVSMIFQNNFKGSCDQSDSIYLSYNAWKTRNQSENLQKSYGPQISRVNSPPLSAKQVRFESPVALQSAQKFPPTMPLSKNPCFPNQLQKDENNLPGRNDFFNKPFEQIYMANIPNRQLDLSMIEPVKPTEIHAENLENVNPNVNLARESTTYTTEHFKNANEPVRFDQFGINKKTVNDCRRYPEKFDRYTTQSTSLKKDDPLEKNRVIDLFNYKRGAFEDRAGSYAHRQTLDNLEFSKRNDTLKDVLKPKSQLNEYSYNSSQPHDCEDEKHICSCKNSKQTNPRSNATVQTEIVSAPLNSNQGNKNSDDPTVKDLLKIIHQQNDQLLVLQKQVAALLNNNRESPKQIKAPPSSDTNVNVFGNKCRTSTQLEAQPLCNPQQKCLPRKGPLPQFSLDVMTSFEVSIRRQQNINRGFRDAINHPPQITEVTETDSNAFENPNVGNVLYGICGKPKTADDTEVSLTLNEPVHVRENCPTPENTVRIDMEDYSSDSSDDENSTNDRWFYKNVQGQVNQILRKSGMWNGSPADFSENCNDVVSQNIRKKVKEATVKHLKSLGVHVPTVDNCDNVMETDSASDVGYNSKEVSFAVKQLLMKYLPNEQLAKFAKLQNNLPRQTEPIGLIERRPEFSFATVQYMQKYNLLTDGRKINQHPPPTRTEENFDRILDVTAIKQQPKLI